MHKALGLGIVLATACGEPPASGPTEAPTWHGDVRPLVERSCVGCHDDGGLAPFSLVDDPAAWADGPPPWASLVVRAVESGVMPPWPASDRCHPVAGSQRLTDAEVAVFTGWRDGGFAAGDPADFHALPVEAPPDPGLPDRRLVAEGDYVASDLLPDDYHCFVVGSVFEADTMVRAIDVQPGQPSIVHHAVAFLVPADGVPAVEAADAAEPGLGYACFGGPVPGNTVPVEHLHAWVPGAAPEVLPAGDARRLPAGSRIVLQMHYNLAGLPPGSAVPPDRTAVLLWDALAEPLALVSTVGLLDTDLPIPAGDPEVVHEKTFRLRSPELVVGVAGHMHQLGSRLRLDVVHRDGSKDCLLAIPKWDFGWQRTYFYPLDLPYTLAPEDALELTCVFDNSPENQPIVDGVRLEPQDRHFGEGSLDEMCLAYTLLRRGHVVEDDARCEPFEACFDRCPEGDGACLMTCLGGVANGCTDCALEGLVTCGSDACGDTLDGLSTCLARCSPLGGAHACLVGPCRGKAMAYLGCVDPEVRAGRCDDALSACGVDLGE